MTRQAYVHHPSRTVVFWTYKGANTSIVHALAFDVFGVPRDIPDPRPALEPYLTNSYSEAQRLILRNGYRSIALIREPYDRLISAFLHIFVARENIGITRYDQLEVVGRTGYASIVGEHKGAFTGLVFRQFAEHCLSAIENRIGEPHLDGHWNTQIPFEFLKQRFEYDFLYPLDRSKEFFGKLGELTGKPISERWVNEHKRSETHIPRNLVDTPSVEYCNDGTLRHPANFEDQALRARVEQAYLPDRIYYNAARAQFDSNEGRTCSRPISIDWPTVPDLHSTPAPPRNWNTPMDRTQLLFSMFDSTGFGLEVGGSYNPFLPKSRFNVETIDHADAATLREKYRDNASQIEEVDYVSDGRSMLEVIGKPERYDFIFASHVIEHVTDIVRFIQDCEALLKPDGRLVLAVPDKRYCFDALRPISTVGQALQAYAERQHRHPAGVLFDQAAYGCTRAGGIVWIEPDLDGVALVNSVEVAKQIFENALASDAYHDAHGWQFTPSSFRFLIKRLRAMGYIKSGELAFHKKSAGQPGMHEFYISLSKTAPILQDTDIDLLKRIEIELRQIRPSRADQSLEDEEKKLQLQLSTAKAELAIADEKVRQLEAVRQALLKSTSWRVTAPMRYVRSLFL